MKRQIAALAIASVLALAGCSSTQTEEAVVSGSPSEVYEECADMDNPVGTEVEITGSALVVSKTDENAAFGFSDGDTFIYCVAYKDSDGFDKLEAEEEIDVTVSGTVHEMNDEGMTVEVTSID